MTNPSGQLIAMSFATVCLLTCVGTGADRQGEAPGPASRPATSSAPLRQGGAEFPRIAMLWAPAETERAESRWDNIARHDVVVLGIQTLGIEWTPHEFHATVESVQEATVRRARRNLAGIHRRNPRAIVLCEVYFFEEHQKGYPPDHPWWLRDAQGKRVRFWPGAYRMDINNARYITHVARRVQAVHKALGGQVGLYLDNLRTDPISQASWLALIQQARKLCGQDLPIVVAAGWQTQSLEWIAPHVNGISYEDAVHHETNADTEAFYGRIRRWERMFRHPRLGVNEVLGKRSDAVTMRRELIRTLVYTDMAYLYADSNRDHAHEWRSEWDISLGRAKDPSRAPARAALARRAFAGGTVLWLPSSAKKPAMVDLDEPMREAFDGAKVRRCTLQPGTGTILLRPSGQASGRQRTSTVTQPVRRASEPEGSRSTGD